MIIAIGIENDIICTFRNACVNFINSPSSDESMSLPFDSMSVSMFFFNFDSIRCRFFS